MSLNVKIKKLHKNAKIPQYAKPGDAGMDLFAVSKTTDEYGNLVYGTGLAFEIPKGYVGLLFPRSSISKISLNLRNSVGVLDSGYRGEVKLKYGVNLPFKPLNWLLARLYTFFTSYNIGDRIAQLVVIPFFTVTLIETDQLAESERGSGGFGHTGN